MRSLVRFPKPPGIALILAAAIVPLICGPASAATKPNKPTVKKFELHPAPEPRPALEYRLLPDYLDQTRGNAASDYYRVIIQWQDTDNDKLDEQLSEWSEMPLEKLPREEIRAKLAKRQYIWDALTRAARRDYCKWQLPIREMPNPFALLIPEVGQMRILAKFVAVKARLEIAEGRFDDATETLQTGYAMARHIAEAPLLINALVGMAVSNIMTDTVAELIAQPQSPNMYWPLTSLPSPIISMRKAVAAEMNMLYLMFPELRDINKMPSTAEHWRVYVDHIYESGAVRLWSGGLTKLGTHMALMALVAKKYPDCKSALIAGGLSPERVEAMPVAQVVALQVVANHKEISDDFSKWFGLPYWQTEKGLKEVDKQLLNRRGTLSLAAILMPALSRCKFVEARTEREIALLRTVEAVRIYAAAHEGRLPNKLADIIAVPLPIDPITGKSFIYRLEGDTGVIDAPAPAGSSNKDDAKTIEIQLIKTNTK